MKQTQHLVSAALAAALLAGPVLPEAGAIPNPVPERNGQFTLSSGGAHTLAILDGSLFAWGDNSTGQLGVDLNAVAGLGPEIDLVAAVPFKVGTEKDWALVAAGMDHSLAVKTDGTLWSWGGNGDGQLGDDSTDERSSVGPRQVGTENGWCAIAAGNGFSLALKEDGRLFGWGKNGAGQIARDLNDPPALFPALIAGTYSGVAAGGDYGLALGKGADAGKIFAWGNNSVGALGLGVNSQLPHTEVRQVGARTDWVLISASLHNSFAINTSGQLWAWGLNALGQLGQGGFVPRSAPVQVGTASDWLSVRAGDHHVLAIRDGGTGGDTLWAWGGNADGQIGRPLVDENNNFITGNFIGLQSPARVGEATGWNRISPGANFSIVQRLDAATGIAKASSFGANNRGQLGNRTVENSQGVIGGSAFNEPDLVVSAVELSQLSTVPVAGGPVTINVSLGNLGTRSIPAAAGIQLDVRFSSDATFGPEDTALSAGPIAIDNAVIPAGGSVVQAVTVTLPAQIFAGDYFVVVDAIAPAALGDITDENNQGATPPSTFNDDGSVLEAPFRFLPDVAVTVEDFAPLTIEGVNRDLTFKLIVSNVGRGSLLPGAAGDFEVAVILSENQVGGDAADVRLLPPADDEDLLTFSGIAAGAVEERTITLDVPLSVPPGRTYNLIVIADPRDPEADPTSVAAVKGQVVESDEDGPKTDGDNNFFVTANPLITVLGISLEEALDAPLAVLDSDGNPAEDDEGNPIPPVPVTFRTGGDSSWFGQDATFVAVAGNAAAARSPFLDAGESAFFETQIQGPVKITFSWSAKTSSSSNRLVFTVDGDQRPGGRIGGNVDFVSVSFNLPDARLNKVRWTYFQETASSGEDAVFVDRVFLEPITQPDLIIDTVSFLPGTYVPQLDRLAVTVLGVNLGTQIPDFGQVPFEVKVVLSGDTQFGNQDDIVLGNLDRFAEPLPNNRFGYSAIRQIPTVGPDGESVIEAGDYFLIARVDPTGVVEEGDETNNTFVSSGPVIQIEPRPDLRPGGVDATGRPLTRLGYEDKYPDEEDDDPRFFIRDVPGRTDADGGAQDKIEVEFSITNEGLADVPAEPFAIDVVLSDDRIFEGSDFVLLSLVEASGLPLGSSRTYKVTAEIPENAPFGRLLNLGLRIDSGEDVTESLEDNNTTGNQAEPPNPFDVILSELPLSEVTEVEDEEIVNGPRAGTGLRHFFGQRQVFFDAQDHDAARASAIGDGETAAFELTVDNDEPSVISFAWKVSSEREVLIAGETETLKEDFLSFSIDSTEVKRISGDVDWTVESFALPAGERTVRWAYTKDGDESARMDTGWVDRIIVRSPNLAFAPDTANPQEDPGLFLRTDVSAGLNRDSEIEVQYRFTNDGMATIGPNAPFTIQFRISPDPQFDEPDSLNKNDFVLGEVEVDDVIEQGRIVVETVTLRIPDDIAEAGDYYLAARLDFFEEVPESNEDDNELFSGNPILPIAPDVNLATALDFEPALGWTTGGDATWFGYRDDPQIDRDNPADGIDAVRTSPQLGADESAFLQTQVTGPALVSFNWRTSTIEVLNFLSFSISGVEQDRISGETPFGLGSGDFALNFERISTRQIAYNASAAVVEAALEEAGNVGPGTARGDITVTGGPSSVAAVTAGGAAASAATARAFGIEFSADDGAGDGSGSDGLRVVVRDDGSLAGGATAAFADGTLTVTIAQGATLQSEVVAAVGTVAGWSAIDLDPAADGAVTITEVGELSYRVAFADEGDQPPIRLNTVGLNRRVTARVVEETAGAAGVAEVQVVTINPRVEFFVPAGEQLVQWVYTKTTNRQAEGVLDAAFIDQVVIDPAAIEDPDLVINTLVTTAGTYIVDRRDSITLDKIPVTVVAENRGQSLPAGFEMTPSDFSVRLSADTVFGNADDIFLGSVGRVESNPSAGQIVFGGEFLLPLDTPEGNYFVAVYIDFNDRVDEFVPDDFVRYTPTDNNLAFTNTRAITVERRADLVVENFVYDNTRLLFPENAIPIRFDVRNRGLKPVPGDEEWIVRVSLRSIELGGGAFFDPRANSIDSVLSETNLVVDLVDIPLNRFLPGVDELNPEGGQLGFQAEVILPTEEFFINALGEDKQITLFDFIFIVEVDQTDRIPESDERNQIAPAVAFRLQPDLQFNPLDSFFEWADFYGIDRTNRGRDDDGDGLIHLLEYALGTNPTVSDNPFRLSAADTLLFGPAIDLVDGTEYLSLAFDFNNMAADLLYFVEVAGADGIYSPLLILEPPYNADHGVRSLTGVNGLSSEAEVISVNPRGNIVRLNVRDIVPADRGTPARMMRLRIREN